MKRLALAVVIVLLWASPAHAVTPNGTYSWWNMPSPAYYVLDGRIFFGSDPLGVKEPRWFAATQFWDTNVDGGYIGLQVDWAKRAIFSWWGATGAKCSSVTGATCRLIDTECFKTCGYQTTIPYDWKAGRSYITRVWKLNATTWAGYIIDETTKVATHVGTMTVGNSDTWLTGAVNWTEWYGGDRPSCADIPQFIVYFHKLAGYLIDGRYQYAAYPPSNVVYTDQACPSSVVNWSDPWARHITPV